MRNILNILNSKKEKFINHFYHNLWQKEFINIKKYRSDSENSNYLYGVNYVLRNKKNFYSFKRNFYIKSVIETVNKELGADFLDILKSRNDGILEKGLSSSLILDNVGNPIKYKYPGYEIPVSPTTLRYLKVSSDLNFLFGNKFKKVAEIGCGYGGQTLVNDQILNIDSVKLFDLPDVNKLIESYLNSYLLRGSFKTTTLNQELNEEYELVISNYAFSELPKILQIKYIEKVLIKAKRGYLTMNTGILNYNNSSNHLTISEIREFLPDIQLLEDVHYRNTNYIIVWGFNKKNLKDFFKIKDF